MGVKLLWCLARELTTRLDEARAAQLGGSGTLITDTSELPFLVSSTSR